MSDPDRKRLLAWIPPLALAGGAGIGIVTDALGLWICIGVAVGAVLFGIVASRERR